MLVSNYRPYPEAEKVYLALRRGKRFWFPNKVKLIAWSLVFGSILTSSLILSVYGMNFGMLKTYLWLTGITISFFLGLLITAPIRIFITCFLEALLKKRTHIYSRKLNEKDLDNPDIPEKRSEVLRARKYKKHLYKPIQEYKLRHRLEDVKYNIELRNIATDSITYLIFLGASVLIAFSNKSAMTYYSVATIEHLLVDGHYTSRDYTLNHVKNTETFYEYLNITFLRAIYISLPHFSELKNERYSDRHHLDEYEQDYEDKIDEKRETHFFRSLNDENESLPRKKRKKVVPEPNYDFEELIHRHVFDRGWTLEPNQKLLGKPRLRQIRVVKGNAGGHATGFQSKRMSDADEFYFMNEDRGSYTLRWNPPPQKGLNPWQGDMWKYKSGWETQSLPVVGKFGYYPAGGYVVELARNKRDASIIMDFLINFDWIDTRTRAIFIELTTYNVNSNLFNVVLLLFEKSAVGAIIPSYEIHACTFLFDVQEAEEIYIISMLMFTLLTFFFLLREGIRVHRTSWRDYFRRPVSMMDVLIILLAFICLSFNVLRKMYVANLLDHLEKSQNNDFVSFIYAGFWCEASVYAEAMLVLLSSFKIIRILGFRVIFFRMQVTLTRALRHFVDLGLEVLVLLSAFSFFFHLVLVYASRKFITFIDTFCTLIGRIIVVEDNFHVTTLSVKSSFIAPFFFFLFVIFVTVLFINIFMAVTCLYFREIQKVRLIEKYEIMSYIKHVLTSPKQADILLLSNKIPAVLDPKTLRLRGGSSDAEAVEQRDQSETKECDKILVPSNEVLRLRGGGHVLGKYFTRKTKEKEKDHPKAVRRRRRRRKLHADSEEEMYDKIKLSNFIFEKKYDTADLRDMPVDRFTAMEYLMLATVSERREIKETARVKACAALFLNLTRGRGRFPRTAEKYFMVRKKNKAKYVILEQKMKEMRLVLENYGRRKHWIIDEIPLTELEQRIYATLQRIQKLNRGLSQIMLSIDSYEKFL